MIYARFPGYNLLGNMRSGHRGEIRRTVKVRTERNTPERVGNEPRTGI